ncbi:MAG: M6 family metalloprotease domain-containing protein [Dictyoglomaceae bacterium]
MQRGSKLFLFLAIATAFIFSCSFGAVKPLTPVKIMPPHEKLLEKHIKIPTLPEITPSNIPQGAKVYGTIERAQGLGKAIVIPIEFSDMPRQPESVIPSNYFNTLFNTIGADWNTINPYNVGSVKDFYRENSYNQFDINATVLPWYTVEYTYTTYINDGDNGFTNGGVFVLVQEALQHAVDSGYDLRNYNVVFVLHSGQGAEWTGEGNDIWSHASTVYVTINGQKVPIRYSIEPEYMEDYDDNGDPVIIPQTVGVFVHEMGHSFGSLPDLYDRDYSSSGLGRWSLMAGGSWNGPVGPGGYAIGGGPSQFDAWSKVQLGWVTPTIPTDNLTNVTIPPVETSPVVYQLWTDGVIGEEYFLIENRQQIGFDTYQRGEGLLIYHVDERMRSTQNDNEWYPGLDPSKHYLVALEQADGLWELEKNLSSGNVGDPYPGSTNNTTFDENSTPNSKAYFEIPTAVAVKNIAVSGDNIICDINVKSAQAPNATNFISHIAWSGQNPLTVRPLFKWETVPYATDYQFQLASDANFNNILINITTQESQYRPTLEEMLDLGTTYYARIRAENANGASSWAVKSFTTPTTLEALLVADDGGEFGIAPYLENALQDSNANYMIIDVFNDNAYPLANYMGYFSWVLWAGDWGAIYDTSIQDEIMSYLDNGGKLFITSQDLGWGYSAGYIDPTFYNDYLKAEFVQDSTDIFNIKGVNDTTFEGLSFSLDTSDSALDQTYPDEIDPLEGAVPILVYNPIATVPVLPEIKLPEKIQEKKAPSIVNKVIASSGTAGLRYVDPEKHYGVVYFAFGLEGVSTEINEVILSKVRELLISGPTLTLTVSSTFNPKTDAACTITTNISDDLGYAYLTIKVYDTLNGQKNNLLKTVLDNEKLNNGTYNFSWKGKDESGKVLSDGKYIIEATAKDEGNNITVKSAPTTIFSNQPLSFADVTKFTKSFNPKEEPAKISFNISQDAKVKFYIYNLAGEKVYEQDLGPLSAGNYEIIWAGVNWKGQILNNGLYLFQLVATSSQGEVRVNRFIAILK